MKLFTYLLLPVVLLLASSFRPAEEVKGYFSATIDGKPFKLRDDQLLKGILEKKSGSMDGRSAGGTIISFTVYGPSYDRPDGRPFNESIQVEMSYEPDKLGEPTTYVLGMQFEMTDYAMVKEQTKVKITQFTWEADHKHFIMAAEFDGKMRSWGYPNDKKSDVNLKGKMSNIRVTVPSWLAKN